MSGSENPMKIIMPLTVVLVVCILSTGCVGQIKNTTVDAGTVNSTITFIPFSNTSSNITNISNSTETPKLKGLLKVSLDTWVGEFPVSIDNVSVGVVKTARPFTLMIDEGNHTVDVCCGAVCEQENVTIRFGEQRTIDFSERLEESCVYLEPAVQIVDYARNGDEIMVRVEFINPTTRTLAMSAEVSCGYSYIESRTNNRVGNLVQGQVFSTVNPGDRITKILTLYLAPGYDYNYQMPTITDVAIQ
jgi:hypothetical protein